MDLKEAWFYLNCIFIINFTLRILRFINGIYLLLYLPNFVNCLILIFAYLFSVFDIIRDFRKLLKNQNFLCIFLFFTFPHWILLIPFYILSIYHVNGYIIMKKKFIYSDIVKKVTGFIAEHSFHLGKIALFTELYASVLSFLMLIFGVSSIKTCVMYIFIIWHQYTHNILMKNIVTDVFHNIHAQGIRLANIYIQLKNKYLRINDDKKTD